MSSVLLQLSVAIGVLMFLAALGLGIVTDVPLRTSLMRSIFVLCGSTIAVAAFFRFFTRVLFRFLADKIQEQQAQAEAAQAASGAEGPQSIPKG
jgi:hypothetical protein